MASGDIGNCVEVRAKLEDDPVEPWVIEITDEKYRGGFYLRGDSVSIVSNSNTEKIYRNEAGDIVQEPNMFLYHTISGDFLVYHEFKLCLVQGLVIYYLDGELLHSAIAAEMNYDDRNIIIGMRTWRDVEETSLLVDWVKITTLIE